MLSAQNTVSIVSQGDCAKRAERLLNMILARSTKADPVEVDFILAIGATVLSDRDGISAAGADAASRRLTPKLDAEALLSSTEHTNIPLPTSPLGVTSPVVLTKAALSLLPHTVKVVDCGAFISPDVSHINLAGRPGADFTVGESLDEELVERLFACGQEQGRVSKSENTLTVLAECVPGGTTTALGVLKLLGIEAKLSGSLPGKSNTDTKSSLVNSALERLGNFDQLRRDCLARPLLAVCQLGDPMQAFAAGFVIGHLQKAQVGANNKQLQPLPLILGGGSQMLAVYALVKACLTADQREVGELSALTKFFAEQVIVITTKWVATDPNAETAKLATLLDAPYVAAAPDFNRSRHAGLRAYEDGHVKEGVGAGAALVLADLLGPRDIDLVTVVDNFYERMTTN